MKRLAIALLQLIVGLAFGATGDEISALFPQVSELPGGQNYWLSDISPAKESGECYVYMSSYIHIGKETEPIFDAPKGGVYNVNIRFYVCADSNAANGLFGRFGLVGEKK
jgi:hypothetical protein